MRETNLSIWKIVIFHAVLQELSLEIYNLWIGYQSLLGFSFKDTDNSQDSRGREATMFYSSLPFLPAHEYSDIYLLLCIWNDYHIFLIASVVTKRLLLDKIYHLFELLFD